MAPQAEVDWRRARMKSSIGMDNTTATSRAKDGWGLLYVRRTRKCAVEGGWREVEAKLLLESQKNMLGTIQRNNFPSTIGMNH